GGNEYEYDRWSQYKAFYNTPDADREYVLYWEKMVKEMKWLENHVLKDFLEVGLYDLSKPWNDN
uniref:Uncharacterized protein n=1 Tax=Aegilops tauschii subsp. strangulata TaxID=200361 RepID=A0A452XF48_AEGTS